MWDSPEAELGRPTGLGRPGPNWDIQKIGYEDEYGDEFEEEIIAGGEEGEEGEEGMEISASEMLGSDGVHA